MNPHILLDIMIGLLIFGAIYSLYGIYLFFHEVGGDIDWDDVDNIDTESK